MFELKNLRLRADSLSPGFTIEYMAGQLGVTPEELERIEGTPMDELKVGMVAHYLDTLALDIKITAHYLGEGTAFQRRLLPDGDVGEIIFGCWQLGTDREALERGAQIVRAALTSGSPDK